MFYRINKRVRFGGTIAPLAVLISIFGLLAVESAAQSTDVNFPTPITGNEVKGTVSARDVGDARLTTHYYLLAGGQGDIFINVVTNNFTGGIDLFAANSMDPVTKIAVYADLGRTETGRVVYLRKSEKLVLRIQGRTPNADPADYAIKFAGSFVALQKSDAPTLPALPKVTAGTDSGVRVNTVGTILERPAPPVAVPDEMKEVASNKTATVTKPDKKPEPKKSENKEKESSKIDSDPKPAKGAKPSTKPVVVKTDNIPTETRPREVATKPAENRAPAKKPAGSSRRSARAGTASSTTSNTKATQPRSEAAAPAPTDPMAAFRLIVLFKDGKTIERPMTEVLRFGVDNGILTIVHKNGSIGRYSMLTVAKVSVE
ncbi:MAG TPA: hypothetical protein DEA22_13880 [Blastocatellia bacterium]|nr:hypothetical protein [Blastocatellia bacterium]